LGSFGSPCGFWRLCSSCRAREAAFGGEAVANPDNPLLLTHHIFRFYDGFAAERSLALLGSCYDEAICVDRDALKAVSQLPTPSPD
jgi:hypothetical protein